MHGGKGPNPSYLATWNLSGISAPGPIIPGKHSSYQRKPWALVRYEMREKEQELVGQALSRTPTCEVSNKSLKETLWPPLPTLSLERYFLFFIAAVINYTNLVSSNNWQKITTLQFCSSKVWQGSRWAKIKVSAVFFLEAIRSIFLSYFTFYKAPLFLSSWPSPSSKTVMKAESSSHHITPTSSSIGKYPSAFLFHF